MGKIIYYLSALVFLDLLFITTGQICNSAAGCSLTSIILDALLNVGNVTHSKLFFGLIGDIGDLILSPGGFFSIIAGVAVTLGAVITRSDTLLFIPIGGALGVLASDFVFLYVYLFSLSPILATFVMTPIIIIYVVTTLEWVRGKD